MHLNLKYIALHLNESTWTHACSVLNQFYIKEMWGIPLPPSSQGIGQASIIKATEMPVAPRNSECFGLPWSALGKTSVEKSR